MVLVVAIILITTVVLEQVILMVLEIMVMTHDDGDGGLILILVIRWQKGKEGQELMSSFVQRQMNLVWRGVALTLKINNAVSDGCSTVNYKWDGLDQDLQVG